MNIDSAMSMRRALRFPIIAALVTALLMAGCGTFIIPPFEGGIRVITEEELVEVPGSEIPIDGAGVNGVLVVTLGPGSGTNTIAGITGEDGIADFPNAYSNATWQLLVQFELSSAPECPDWGPNNRNGGPGGLEETVICISF